MADSHKNFAYSTIATVTSQTSVNVQSGQGSYFPTPPFNVTVWPANTQPTNSNATIRRCTAVSTDTLTLSSAAQESSPSRTIIAGDQIAATITAKTLTDVENKATYVTVGSSNADYVTTGINDNSTIVSAISAVSAAGGGTVYIREGTYNLGGNIEINSYSNVVIQGAGQRATILRVASASVFNAVNLTSSSNITIKDLEIDGNKSSYSNAYCLSAATSVSDCKFINLYIHDSPKNNVHFFFSSDVRNQFINCEVAYAALTGLVLQDCVDCDVVKSYFHNNGSRDIYHFYSAGGGSNNSVIDCRCVSTGTDYNIQSRIDGSVIKGNITNGGIGGIGCNRGAVVIVGNKVSGTTGEDAIAVAEPTLTSAVISNNHITGTSGSFNGIFVGDGCGPTTVTGNYITNFDRGGIRLFGASYTTVTGNTLYRNSVNTGGNGNYNEIWLGTSSFGGGIYPSNYNTISDNTIITQLAPYCINLASEDYNTVTGNTLIGGTSGAINGLVTVNSEIANNKGDTSQGSLTKTGRLGVLNAANTTAVYMNTFAGAGRIISEKHDFTNTGRPLTIATKNSIGETARFDASGNFGVGNTSLSLRIESASNIGVLNSTNATTVYLDTTTSAISRLISEKSDFSGTPRTLTINTKAAKAESVRIDTSGNVGIGTIAATEKLQIQSGSSMSIELATPTSPAASLVAGGSLTVGTPYYYKMTALDGVGETIGSSEVTATPTTGNQTISLSWTAVTGATSYKVYRSTTSGSYGATSLLANPSTNSQSDDGSITLTTGTVPSATTAYMVKIAPLSNSWLAGGKLGIGVNVPTATLHLKAGTTSANTAPLKFTSGSNLTTAEAGAMEWDGTNLYISQTTGPTRKTLAYTDSNITGNAATVTNGVYTTGSYSDPSWITSLAASKVSGSISGNAANVTGTVAVANGGTGQTTYTDGQLLIGNSTGNTLAKATLTQGTGITITNGSGTITIANGGVTSLAGTTNQVTASASTGSVTLSLPQDIATASTPQFAGIGIGVAGGSKTLTLQVQAGSSGVVNSTNTTAVYIDTVSGVGRLISEKHDFTNTGRPLTINSKNTKGETARFDASGNVSVGTAALSTSATDGFLYIPTCAGAPTGTPTSKTGLVPMIYDTTNNNFYFYSGGWKKTTTFA